MSAHDANGIPAVAFEMSIWFISVLFIKGAMGEEGGREGSPLP